MQQALAACALTMGRQSDPNPDKPTQAQHHMRKVLLAQHVSASAQSPGRSHFVGMADEADEWFDDGFEEMYNAALADPDEKPGQPLQRKASMSFIPSVKSQKAFYETDNVALRDPTGVPLSLYVRTQLRALKYSMENGYRYHKTFNTHVEALKHKKAMQPQNIATKRFLKQQQRQLTASPVELITTREARQRQVAVRAATSSGALQQWYNSQIELRRHVSGSSQNGPDDVFTIVAKKWATHVVTSVVATNFMDIIARSRAARENEANDSSSGQYRSRRRMTVQERTRRWVIVRRVLREYVIRFKRRRCGAAVNLVLRFLRHYRQMNRLVKSIPEYRNRVVLCQRQVRRFFGFREARRILLVLQWIADECQALGVENAVLVSLRQKQGSTGMNLSRNRHQSLSLNAATLSYVKERRLKLSSTSDHPHISEVHYVPPGGSEIDARYRWACTEATKWIRTRVKELLHYERQWQFYVAEKVRYSMRSDASVGVAPPRRPIHPIQYLFANPDELRLTTRAQRGIQNASATVASVNRLDDAKKVVHHHHHGGTKQTSPTQPAQPASSVSQPAADSTSKRRRKSSQKLSRETSRGRIAKAKTVIIPVAPVSPKKTPRSQPLLPRRLDKLSTVSPTRQSSPPKTARELHRRSPGPTQRSILPASATTNELPLSVKGIEEYKHRIEAEQVRQSFDTPMMRRYPKLNSIDCQPPRRSVESAAAVPTMFPQAPRTAPGGNRRQALLSQRVVAFEPPSNNLTVELLAKMPTYSSS